MFGRMGCMGNEHTIKKQVVAREGRRKAGAAVTFAWGKGAALNKTWARAQGGCVIACSN